MPCVVVAVAGVACGGGVTMPVPGGAVGAPTGVHGRLLLSTGAQGTDIAIAVLPSPRIQDVRLPTSSGPFSFPVVFFGGDGTAYAATTHRRAQVWAISPSEPPRAVGRSIDVGCTNGIQVVGAVVAVSGCGTGRSSSLFLFDADRGGPWQRFDGVGVGALSPDLRSMAYEVRTKEGSEIWQRPIDGSAPPSLLFSLGSLPAMKAAGIVRPLVWNGIIWGPGGIAVGVAAAEAVRFGGGSGAAIVVWTTDGAVRTVRLGGLLPGPMAWQPGGRLLAFVDYVTQGAGFRFRGEELRTVDPVTGRIRQIAVGNTNVFANQVAWSPDGTALAWPHALGDVTFFDPSGHPLGRLAIEGSPYVWGD